MLILAIDTATKTAGVALLKDGFPYGEINLNVGLTHSVSLLPAMNYLLKSSNIQLADIDVLAFANGPGSFTGLRIGGAFITGLAQIKNLPIYAIPTLDALALNAEGFNGIVAPILDARKNEFYTATYTVQKGYINKVTSEKAISCEEFCEQFDRPQEVMVVGDAVPKYREMLSEKGFIIPSEISLYPRPLNIAYCAYKNYLKSVTPSTFREIKLDYLRPSEAEVKLLEKSR